MNELLDKLRKHYGAQSVTLWQIGIHYLCRANRQFASPVTGSGRSYEEALQDCIDSWELMIREAEKRNESADREALTT